MKRTTMIVAGLIAIPAFTLLAAAATQQYCTQFPDTGTFHCFSTYETSSDALSLRVSCDQLPKTLCPSDGHFDAGGVMYDGGRSPDHQINGGNPDRDLPVFNQFGTTWDEEVYVNDAVFGANVGVFYCQDVNGNGLCGESNISSPEGQRHNEPAFLFCGHKDLGPIDTSSFVWAGYYVVGPVFQGRDCQDGATTLTVGPTGTTVSVGSNPIGGTSGSVSIWLAPVPPPPPGGNDGNHDSPDYGVWGGAS